RYQPLWMNSHPAPSYGSHGLQCLQRSQFLAHPVHSGGDISTGTSVIICPGGGHSTVAVRAVRGAVRGQTLCRCAFWLRRVRRSRNLQEISGFPVARSAEKLAILNSFGEWNLQPEHRKKRNGIGSDPRVNLGQAK